MTLKILLPFRVFAEIKEVIRIVIETPEGSYGLLPQRLDCVAALVPGIFTYETETGGTRYLAVDAGVIVKAGMRVLVSVQNAVGGADLGKLGDMVKEEINNHTESENEIRSLMAKLESGFIYSFDKFRSV